LSNAADLKSDLIATLADHGQDVTFRRVVNGGYDPATGTIATSSNDDETVRVHMQAYNESQSGGLIQAGDRKVYMSPETTAGTTLTKEPQIGDEIIGQDDAVTVVNVKREMSEGDDVVWILQVRE